MLKVLIIDSDPAISNARFIEDQGVTIGGNFAEALHACRDDLEITIVAPYDGEELPALDQFDGVVFTGSTVEWNTDDARAAPLAQVMRSVFAEGLPTLGMCNGMQLAASVLGGSSAASPNGEENGLARGIILTEAGRRHPFLQGRADGYAVPCAHRDEVRSVPEGAVVLAGNALSGVQAFAYEKDGITFWGTQYHPELDPKDLGRRMLKWGGMPEEQARDLSVSAEDTEAAARLGIRSEEMQPALRLTELRNWLASL